MVCASARRPTGTAAVTACSATPIACAAARGLRAAIRAASRDAVIAASTCPRSPRAAAAARQRQTAEMSSSRVGSARSSTCSALRGRPDSASCNALFARAGWAITGSVACSALSTSSAAAAGLANGQNRFVARMLSTCDRAGTGNASPSTSRSSSSASALRCVRSSWCARRITASDAASGAQAA